MKNAEPSDSWKLWRNVRPMDLEPYYIYWVSHLTSEGLHAKSDIATVLAVLHQQRDDNAADALRLHQEKMDLLYGADGFPRTGPLPLSTRLEEDLQNRLRTERWKGFSHHEHDLVLAALNFRPAMRMIEWIDLDDRRPEGTGEVLVVTRQSRMVSTRSARWVRDLYQEVQAGLDKECSLSHWASFPGLPPAPGAAA